MRSQPVDEIQTLARALVVGVVQATAHCADSESARALRRTAVSIGLELANQRAAHRGPRPVGGDAASRIAALGVLLEAARRQGSLAADTAQSLTCLQNRTCHALDEAGDSGSPQNSAAT